MAAPCGTEKVKQAPLASATWHLMGQLLELWTDAVVHQNFSEGSLAVLHGNALELYRVPERRNRAFHRLVPLPCHEFSALVV